MTITKKELQDALKPLATKVDASEAQTKDLDKKLQAQSKELKAHAVEQTEELARIINGSFQDQHDYIQEQFQTQVSPCRSSTIAWESLTPSSIVPSTLKLFTLRHGSDVSKSSMA